MWKHVISVFALFTALFVTATAEGNCNKRRQPGATVTVELPDVPADAAPFRFDKPDPARSLPEVPYSLDPNGKSVFLVGVSGGLSADRAMEVQAGILRLFQESMCRPDDVMVVWNADHLTRIATFRNGDRVQDCSQKWLKFKIANNKHEIARFNQHFQELRRVDYQGVADLNVPRLVDFLGQEFHEFGDYPNRVMVLYGSAIYVDRNKGNSLENAYPTVGTLRAPLSPFSTRDKASYLGNVVTHFVHNEDFANDIHRRGLMNWWSAYFRSMASPLLTFSPDTRVSERVLRTDLPVIPAYVDDMTPGFISVDTTEVGDLFGPIKPGRSASSPVERGPLMLGLKFDRNLDLDLWVNLRGKPERLSFSNPRTDFGFLRKRFDTGWEEVLFTDEVNIRDVELWVSFYAGSAPPGGAKADLRVNWAGQLFSSPVTFPPTARTGNKGKPGSPEHWVPVDLRAVVSGRK